jgi:hypothetical protein
MATVLVIALVAFGVVVLAGLLLLDWLDWLEFLPWPRRKRWDEPENHDGRS